MTTAFRIISALIAFVGWPIVILYAPRLRTSRASAFAWNLMALTFALSLAFTVLAVGAPGLWRAWVWMFVAVVIFLALAHRLALLLHGIRQDRLDDVSR